jgi:hypothetical protein
LKEMPKDFVPRFVALGISALQPFHPRNEISFRRFQQQVKMGAQLRPPACRERLAKSR